MFSIRIILMLLLTGLGLGLFGATGYALWRWIAGGPALYVVVVALQVLLEIRSDPTAHNLWPFEALSTLVIASAVSTWCGSSPCA